MGAGRTPYRTDFTYDSENKPTRMTFGDTNNQVEYAYDAIGRVSSRTVTAAGQPYATAYGYAAGSNGDGNTTPLIASITQMGESFSYTYDDVGNIASVTQNGKTTAYTYDALGQLIRVDDENDATSGAAGTTWTYAYDQGGNILEKKRYNYTTDTLGQEQETVVYSYDTTWKDKLIGYNGITIEYDAIGNPTKVGTKNGEVWGSDTWTYIWEKGRQLKQMSKTGTTASFVYNADGLRVQKTVNNVVTNYTLHGKNVVHLTQGSDSLHFWYDASGRPAMVEWNDGTTTAKYAYIHNLQGDIVGIVDSNGTEVVKYTYDAWGKVLSTTGSLAATLGMIQPFRYRGYVYDVETGLYYLRSRYYNSDWNRFVNADTIMAGGLFTYCNNSPIINKDPNGKYSPGIYSEDGEEEIFISKESYEFYLSQQALKESRAQEVKKLIEEYSYNVRIGLYPSVRYNTVSKVLANCEYFIEKGINFRGPNDSGCAMFIRSAILNMTTRDYSDHEYYAGASSMFNYNMLVADKISAIGGVDNLIVGMILGTQMSDTEDDGKYHIEHVGIYAGLHDFGNGLEPAVYSFNTDNNCGNLRPFYSYKDPWVYFGWHRGIISD